MRISSHLASVLPLLACACAVESAQDPTGREVTAGPSSALAPAEVGGPMASFARMESGEWRRPALTRWNTFETWHWGPGKHSMLSQSYGSDVDGEPWRALHVFYWHPGRERVCLLDLSCFARGVSEGTVRFEGETADAVFDLYQTGQHRKMSSRWVFHGPDAYHATLLEDSGSGFTPLVEWDYVRFETRSSVPPPRVGEAPKPSQHLKALESLLGKIWTAKGNWAAAEALDIETAFEWIPYVDAIHVRVLSPTGDGGPMHLLDAYVFHHTGTDVLRCLALSHTGGVYEGDLTVLEGGALQLDLKGYEGDRVVRHVARFDLESDGALRQRVWSLEGQERTPTLDVRHEPHEPKQD
ncbi:MAG: hypothetical protein ACKVXR_12900 [Planctomycetota bacterium]